MADLNHVVVWIVSTHPLISKSSSPCTNPLVTVPSAQITIGITVTFMFHSLFVFFFFQFLNKVQVLIFFFSLAFFLFYSVVSRNSEVLNSVSSLILSSFFFFFFWLSLGLIVWPWLSDLFVSQNPRGVCAPHSPRNILVCVYLFLRSNFKFLHSSQWINFPIQSSNSFSKMVFHWSLRDCKNSLVSRTLQSILADLASAVIWIFHLQFALFFSPSFKDRSESNNNWYHNHPGVPQLFHFTGKIQVFFYLFDFFLFYSMIS